MIKSTLVFIISYSAVSEQTFLKKRSDAKSVHCDQYHGQVLEEEAPFLSRSESKEVCTLRRFLCREFAWQKSIT